MTRCWLRHTYLVKQPCEGWHHIRLTQGPDRNGATPGSCLGRKVPMLDTQRRPRSQAVAIETHGCKLNQADSEALARQFLKTGYRLVSMDEPADVYVVNTCTVTHIADRKARQALRAASRRNPEALIVATGCYSQRSPVSLARVDGVGLVIDNTAKADLVQQVLAALGEASVPCAVGVKSLPSSSIASRTRAMIKIQEGSVPTVSYPRSGAGSAAYPQGRSSLT